MLSSHLIFCPITVHVVQFQVALIMTITKLCDIFELLLFIVSFRTFLHVVQLLRLIHWPSVVLGSCIGGVWAFCSDAASPLS